METDERRGEKTRNHALRVLGWCVLGALLFSSCTCQKDLPDPPARRSKLNTDRGWGNLPKSRERQEIERREIPKRDLRERGKAVPKRTPLEQLVQDEIPSDFPGDVPIFKDAEVVGVQKMAAGGKNVLFSTDSEVPEVFEYYRDEMNGEGWNLEQEYQRGEQSFLSFEKDGVITNMTVATNPETGKRTIAVMYYNQQPLPFEEF